MIHIDVFWSGFGFTAVTVHDDQTITHAWGILPELARRRLIFKKLS